MQIFLKEYDHAILVWSHLKYASKYFAKIAIFEWGQLLTCFFVLDTRLEIPSSYNEPLLEYSWMSPCFEFLSLHQFHFRLEGIPIYILNIIDNIMRLCLFQWTHLVLRVLRELPGPGCTVASQRMSHQVLLQADNCCFTMFIFNKNVSKPLC